MSSATAGTSKNVHPQTAPAKPIRNLAALSRLRARARQLHLFDGLVGLGRAVLLAAAASFVLDYLLDLPWGVRLFFLMVGLSLLVAWTAARLVRPLSRVIPDESLALLVEASNPDLHQSLITAIELTRPGVEGARHVSADLIASVVADVESRAREIAFDRIFRLRHLRRRAVLLGILTGAILVLSIASPGLASIWLERNLLLRGTKWPKETILQQYPPIPETVAVGDDLLVEVRVLRGDPRTVALESETPSAARRTYPMLRKEKASWDVRIVEAGGDPSALHRALGSLMPGSGEELVGLTAQGLPRDRAEEIARGIEEAGGAVELESRDVFVHEFSNVSEPLTFFVQGGDDRIGPFRVDVRLRPRIDMGSISVRCRFPAYTGRGDEEHSQTHGNLKVPVGTRVTYSMATNIPVAKAFFVLRTSADGGDAARSPPSSRSQASWPDTGAVALRIEDGKRFSDTFTVWESGCYYFQFEDLDGFRSERPETFRIQAVPDRKPRVRIVRPDRVSEEVSPAARVPIRVAVDDDFGIRRVTMEGAFYAAGQETPVRQSVALLDAGSGDPQAAGEEREIERILEVAQIQTGGPEKPAPGGRFEFYVLAEDHGETGRSHPDGSPMGNVGESQVHLLEIVEPDFLERILTDQLMVVRDSLRQLLSRQQAVRKEVEDLRDRKSGQDLTREEAVDLSRLRRDQSKIGEGIVRQVSEVDRVLERMEINSVGKIAWKQWVQRIRAEMSALSSGEARAAETQLEDLRRAIQEGPESPARLDAVSEAQRRVERGLRSLVLRLEEFGDRSAILQLLREVRDRQKELMDQTSEEHRRSTAGQSGDE